jgi:Asp-tRNA(Asn)/Glu-tRNA(Gln) amidotransferase A subunit family amidase
VLPLAASLDHVGVMGRSVRDLAVLLQPIITPAEDVTGPGAPGLTHVRPRRDPVRLGRLRGPFDDLAAPEARDRLDAFARRLTQRGGCEVVDVTPPPEFAEVWANHRLLMAAGAADYHGARFRRRPDDYPPKIAALVAEGLACGGAALAAARAHRELAVRAVVPLFDALDALLTPAAPGPAPGRETTGDAVFNAPWSYLRLPTASFPIGAGADHGLPLAAQLTGAPAGERDLLAVAAWCEGAHGWEAGWPPEPRE